MHAVLRRSLRLLTPALTMLVSVLIFYLASFNLALAATVAPASAGTAQISGQVIEAGSGLPLLGVTVATDGPTAAKTLTDVHGKFTLANLLPGSYELIISLTGYVTTASDRFPLIEAQTQSVTLVLAKSQSVTSGIKLLGRTTIHGSASLQTAAVISASVSAQSMASQGVYKAADSLLKLPGVINGGSDGATPGDTQTIAIRGIGELETTTLIDGNPIGPGFSGPYSFQLSPVFGLEDVRVLYGSGSDLYGVNAIGGVVDMQTLNPTLHPTITLSQGYGTWNNFSSSIATTGSTEGGKFGYAVALGTQGQGGFFKHDYMYQASAAFDPYATDPAVRALGYYPDDTSLTLKSSLVKSEMNFSDTSHLTFSWLSSAWWDDKTGNGDNDYLPYEVALASGESQLAAAAASGGMDPCYNVNKNTFQPGANANGSTPGTGPNGKPDVPPPPPGVPPVCVTPQRFANLTDGWQGAGTAWQALRSNVYNLRYEKTNGDNTLSINTFTNMYRDSVDRTAELPFTSFPTDAAQWTYEQASNTGITASDDILGKNNEFGFGYFWENSAYAYLLGTQPTGGVLQPSPIFHQSSYFVRDAWHPVNSHLTTYANVWFKHATETNSALVDPRLAFVYAEGSNVFRVAGGKTSTEPFAADIESPFVPKAVGTFLGNVVCQGNLANPVGSIPSSLLKPEIGVDEEFSYGHRFYGDTTTQLTLYNENILQQIYEGLNLPLSVLNVPFDPTPYIDAVATACGISPAEAATLVGVNGATNIGHVLARGIDLTGRIRATHSFFVDYTYDTESTALKSADPELVNPNYGGSLFLIPNSQLPNVPLHKWSFTLDYTFWHDIEAQLATYHESENNQSNLPAYTYSNFSLSVPIGASTFTTSVDNLWQTYADYRGLIGEGYPLALNSFATHADYEPYFGAEATERFGLPLRTINFNYSLRIK
jgi:outer membrane receptor protein involved in Fe transport